MSTRVGDGCRSTGPVIGDIRVGTCSWTERTLVEESDFYPPHIRTAEDRLRFYASQYPLVEVDSTLYRLPSMPTEDAPDRSTRGAGAARRGGP